MLKGVCAQCLQWQINPETGKRTKAMFACSWQDEPIELIDFDHIDDRHEQNRMQEILGELWLEKCIQKTPITKLDSKPFTDLNKP
jgi:hypothetical protein